MEKEIPNRRKETHENKFNWTKKFNTFSACCLFDRANKGKKLMEFAVLSSE